MSQQAEAPIGIFDSGIGGLTVVRQIHRWMPGENLIYLGDTARVPYGTKSPETVIRFACENTQFLLRQNVKAVIVACNTASAWSLPKLAGRFRLPIFGVIQPGVLAALKLSRRQRIGVMGTSATIRSQAYRRGILALNKKARVFNRACPLLVPLVEEGWTRHPVTRLILREYLLPLLRRDVDTLVLGCTHYPLLKRLIGELAGPDVRLVDSAASCAQFVRRELERRQMLRPYRSNEGWIQPHVTHEAARFDRLAHRFLGSPAEPAQKVELSNLENA